jgi:hypothetical protein
MALFKLGSVVATPGALRWCEEHRANPLSLIGRHIQGDWGDLGTDDIKANVDALAYDGRVLSSYNVGGAKVFVITEWDRSVTTLLLASEY